MATSSNHFEAHRSPFAADRIHREAGARECGSDVGRGEREDWKNKCARLEAGRELEVGLSIRWCAPRRREVRAAVGDGEVTASKRLVIACALGQAPRNERPRRQGHRLQRQVAARQVVLAGAGFGPQRWARTRPNLALEPTLSGRPHPAATGQACPLSLRGRARPASTVGSALR